MKTQELEDVDLARSAVSSTGEIVAAKWTPLLIHELGGGTRRFRELERVCEGMSTRTLADRLRTLEQAGVVARHSYPESPPTRRVPADREGPGAPPDHPRDAKVRHELARSRRRARRRSLQHALVDPAPR